MVEGQQEGPHEPISVSVITKLPTLEKWSPGKTKVKTKQDLFIRKLD